ncbi:hypothetical protein CAPTEDRAFT_114175, partial [Capitella teleta]
MHWCRIGVLCLLFVAAQSVDIVTNCNSHHIYRSYGNHHWEAVFLDCSGHWWTKESLPALPVNCTVETLLLNNNHLSGLPASYFENQTDIGKLEFESNRFLEIPEDTLQDLNVTMDLNFKGNDVRDIKLKNILAVKSLNLADNKFEALKPSYFNNLPFLEVLTLDGNQIKVIENDTFQSLVLLKSLSLSGTHIYELPGHPFANLSKLTNLDLSNNMLSGLQKSDFVGLRNLEKLILTNNRIKSIESAVFTELASLTSLRMDRNDLEVLESDVFVGLEAKLQHLHLQYNWLIEIDDAISGLANLIRLVLTYNPIVRIPNAGNMTSLIILGVTGTRI